MSPRSANEQRAGVALNKIVCGGWHTAALTAHGVALTWGFGADGRLGHGDARSLAVPRVVEALRGVRVDDVAAGGASTIFVHKRRSTVKGGPS